MEETQDEKVETVIDDNKSFDNKMIEAFIGKPEKTVWYTLSFSKFNVNGVDTMKWNWSWWAFFGGFFFLLYRKQYIPALVVFIASVVLGIIPFGSLLVAILTGGYSTYFIYKGYKEKLAEVQRIVEGEDKQIETIAALGGVNKWVVWFYAFLVIISLIIFVSYVSLFFSASTGSFQ